MCSHYHRATQREASGGNPSEAYIFESSENYPPHKSDYLALNWTQSLSDTIISTEAILFSVPLRTRCEMPK